MKRNTKESIQKNLKYVAIVIVILFLLFSLIYRSIISEKLEKDVITDIEKEVDLISKEANIFFSKYYEIVRQMGTNELLKQYILASEDRGMYNEYYEETINTIHKIDETDTEIALVWIGMIEENNILGHDLAWHTKEGFQILERPWFKDMDMNNNVVSFAKPYRDAGTDHLIISIMTPVYEDDELIGALGIDIEIDNIVDFISNYIIGEDGFALLTTSDGELIASAKDISSYASLNDYLTNSCLEQECEVLEITEKNEGIFYFAHSQLEKSELVVSTFIPKNQTRYLINLFNILSWIILGIFLIMLLILGVMLKLSTNLTDLNYLYDKLRRREKELKESNEEMNAAYQQLSASEEELQSQYDEIQVYTSRIEELKHKYDLAIELTNISVWDYNTKTEEVRFNNDFFSGDRYADEQYYNINDYMSNVLDAENFAMVVNSFKKYIDGENEELYCQLNIGDNWFLLQGRFYDYNKRELLSGTMIEITKMKKQEQKIEKMANIDPLTNIPNRRNFKTVLQNSIDAGRHGAVILLDLDNFKEINDTMGHVFGDSVLKSVANKLKSVESENIRVSRFGGDEFLLEISCTSSKYEIKKIIEELISNFREKIVIDREVVFITMSMGVTLYPEDSNMADDLIMNADLAMYSVKTAGKNNYAFYSEEMRKKAKDRNRIERILRQSIDDASFKVLYQPQVEVATGNICSYEALIRLKNYKVSPGEFIPIAEDSGLIVPIGRWITEEVIRQLAEWRDDGKEIKTVSINFSAKQLADETFIDFLKAKLEKYKIAPEFIEIEITESIFFDEENETIELLNKFREMGISISLDDFGTGYSSFSYLTYLPLNKLKLDKSLSERFIASENDDVIESIIALAHSIGLQVIAEGIETEEQFRKIRQAYGDIIQGYYFSKPVEASEVMSIKKFDLPK